MDYGGMYEMMRRREKIQRYKNWVENCGSIPKAGGERTCGGPSPGKTGVESAAVTSALPGLRLLSLNSLSTTD